MTAEAVMRKNDCENDCKNGTASAVMAIVGIGTRPKSVIYIDSGHKALCPVSS
eukprot:COSAG02_NODE_316_length_24889_cov_9.418556_16_plen_53_part_00